MNTNFNLSSSDVDTLYLSLYRSLLDSKELLMTRSNPTVRSIIFENCVDFKVMLLRLRDYRRSL